MLLRDVDPGDEKVRDLALDIAEMAKDLREFISRWECEPLIFTGRGSTDEIISLLDSLLSKADRAARRAKRSV